LRSHFDTIKLATSQRKLTVKQKDVNFNFLNFVIPTAFQVEEMKLTKARSERYKQQAHQWEFQASELQATLNRREEEIEKLIKQIDEVSNSKLSLQALSYFPLIMAAWLF
jgi:septal ring factor EnvC (AmiA/AmiB activator)